MRRVWVIRGGDEDGLVDELVAGGYIAVGYPDITDGTTVDRYDVTERLRARGWTNPEARADMFHQFVHQLAPGHLVVLPDTRRREVVVGRVEGGYEFRHDLDAEEHRHRRPVTWLARHSVDVLPESLRDAYRQRQVLTERSALLAHAEAVERGELGRDPRDTARPTAQRSPGSRPTTSPRKPAAPKAPPHPAPPAGKVCDGCFLRKAADLFPGGGTLCVDCA